MEIFVSICIVSVQGGQGESFMGFIVQARRGTNTTPLGTWAPGSKSVRNHIQITTLITITNYTHHEQSLYEVSVVISVSELPRMQ